MKPAPRNVAASVHQQLKNVAQRTGERVSDLLHHYALERFLYRLAASEYRERFVLKGALMLRAWHVVSIRPTRDIDLLGRLPSDVALVGKAVRDVCVAQVDRDGLEFDETSVELVRIAQESLYQGLRATFAGTLGKARLPMQVDIGFGDRVSPKPVVIEYPSILGTPGARIMGYTPESTIAEKLHVMLHRGTLNSRMKDFFDVWALSRSRAFDGAVLSEAVRSTCEQRGMIVPRSRAALWSGLLADPQKSTQWTAFRRRLGPVDAPETFAIVVGLVAQFVEPIIGAVAEGRLLARSWAPHGPWR